MFYCSMEPMEDQDHNQTRMSTLWNIFGKIGKDRDGTERAACNYCSTDFAIGINPRSGISYGTSHLMHHVFLCKAFRLNLFSLEEQLALPQSTKNPIVICLRTLLFLMIYLLVLLNMRKSEFGWNIWTLVLKWSQGIPLSRILKKYMTKRGPNLKKSWLRFQIEFV